MCARSELKNRRSREVGNSRRNVFVHATAKGSAVECDEITLPLLHRLLHLLISPLLGRSVFFLRPPGLLSRASPLGMARRKSKGSAAAAAARQRSPRKAYAAFLFESSLPAAFVYFPLPLARLAFQLGLYLQRGADQLLWGRSRERLPAAALRRHRHCLGKLRLPFRRLACRPNDALPEGTLVPPTMPRDQ